MGERDKGGVMSKQPLYSIGTWDTELQAYTQQDGCESPSINVDIHGLRRHLRELRDEHSYTAHRRRDDGGDHCDNDFFVLVERTDGMSLAEILTAWKR